MSSRLQQRWRELWHVAKATPPPNCFEQLQKAYSRSERRYHNLQHISECLDEFLSVKHLAHNPIALELAIWFHDVVYDSHASDNEEQSAALAERSVAQTSISRETQSEMSALILATKHHVAALHSDAGLIVDIDLSILGQSETRFWQYERAIREEYSWVPSEVFSPKRRAILQRFLARPRIYNTETFFARYEKSARRNLSASIDKLGHG